MGLWLCGRGDVGGVGVGVFVWGVCVCGCVGAGAGVGVRVCVFVCGFFFSNFYLFFIYIFNCVYL